jgi:signal transduction histidine kinase
MQLDHHPDWPLPASELLPALELMRSVARADYTALLLHDEATGELVPALVDGMDGDRMSLLGVHTPGNGAFGMVMTTPRRLVIRNAMSHDGLADLARAIGFRHIEIIPLCGVREGVVGELAIMYRRSRRTSRRTVRVVEDLAKLVVCAVLQARRGFAAEQARDSVQHEVSRRTEALARVSHELRTPLQSIAGYVDLLREGAAEPLAPEQARLIGRVYDSEQMLEHVIDDLVALSRIETGHARYAIAAVPATEALRITQAVVLPAAARRGITLSIGECPDIVVAADADKLNQILVNLAVNAVKFSPRGGTVRLTCGLNGGGNMARFDIIDHGCGIPVDALERIFEPYVQLSGSSQDGFGGSGLGLAISRDFARSMYGDLTVVSTVGAGSTFTVHLPRANAATLGKH